MGRISLSFKILKKGESLPPAPKSSQRFGLVRSPFCGGRLSFIRRKKSLKTFVEYFNGTSANSAPRNAPVIICLTGKMAAGKNFIAELLKSPSCAVTDLDQTVHQAVSLCQDKILLEFEPMAKQQGILLTQDNDTEKTLNRRALGKLLFKNPKLLQKHESIIYPVVIELTKNFIEKNTTNKSCTMIILNATVLYKTPELMHLCKRIYFVDAPLIKRIFRAKKRDKMPLRQIFDRFRAQKGLLAHYKKTGIPLFIIKN